MMKLIYCLAVLSCLQACTYKNAHANNDSLWTIWQDVSLSDSIRLGAINHIVYQKYSTDNPETALPIALQILEYTDKTKNKLHQARSHSRLGHVQFRMRNMIGARNSFSKAAELFEEIKNRKGLAGSYFDLGLTYFQIGHNSNALKYYLKSVSLYEELNQVGRTSGLINNIGLIYKHQKDYINALEYFRRSAKIASDNGWSNHVALSNIGDVYFLQGNYDKALSTFANLIEKAEAEKDRQYEGRMSNLYRNIADVHSEQGNLDAALKNYLISLEHFNRDTVSTGISTINTELGLFYVKIGDTKSAIKLCTNEYNIGRQSGSTITQHITCKCLYQAYKLAGDNTKALAYFELYQMLDDSLKEEETVKTLQQMEFNKQLITDSLQQAEEELKVKLAHQEDLRKKDKAQYISMSTGVLLLIIALALYGRFRITSNAKSRIETEKQKSDDLLLNILPAEIAEELKKTGKADAKSFEQVTVMFTDFKEFTQTSEKLSAQELVEEINICFKAFDEICSKYKVEKIKTIGDAYMAVGGLPVPTDDSVKNTVLAAIEMQEFMGSAGGGRRAADDLTINTEQRTRNTECLTPSAEHQKPNTKSRLFEMRVGIHTGPVVAGIVGVKKFQYDIWGDTVNTASRAESESEVGKVNITAATYKLLKDDPQFEFEKRGKIKVKGKGELEMCFAFLNR